MRRQGMKTALLIGSGLVLALCSDIATAQDISNMDINFESSAEQQLWTPVNDGVMGGRSSGGPSFTDGNLVFAGIINTNGGGFSSLRRMTDGQDMANASLIKMRVKSDGRAYRMSFRTDVTYRGRRIAFQKPIPATTPGQWEIVTLTLDNMQASLFGRQLSGAEFIPEDIVQAGIILADGQNGPFRLEVDWIKTE